LTGAETCFKSNQTATDSLQQKNLSAITSARLFTIWLSILILKHECQNTEEKRRW